MSLNLIFGYGTNYYFTPVITCPNGLENVTARFKYSESLGSGSMNTNISIGENALSNNGNLDTGTEWYQNSVTPNIAIGANALRWNTKGYNNIAIGNSALYNNQTHTDNIIIGHHNPVMCAVAGPGETSIPISCGDNGGSKTVAIGTSVLTLNDANSNIGIGHYSLACNVSGFNNTSLGVKTLSNNVVGANNTAIGHQALLSFNGSQNTAVGAYSLKYTTTLNNTAIGYAAGFNNTGVDNIFIGHQVIGSSGTAPPSGFEELEATNLNTQYTLLPFNSGSRIISIGNNSLINNEASNTIAIGYDALEMNTTGTANVALGVYALQLNTSGANNTAIGVNALHFNTNGGSNIGIGIYSLYNNITGSANTFVGNYSGRYNQAGDNSTGVGYQAVGAATDSYSGWGNTGVGYRALYNLTTGFDNVAIGKSAGSTLTEGFNNSMIGNGAQASSVSATNEITLGNASINTLRCATSTITTFSDIRDKTNIENIPVGLEYINALRPVKFDWNTRDGSKIGLKEFGFIAQELDLIEQQFGYQEYTRLVNKNNPDRLEIDYMKTYPILIKAIQELSNKVDYILNHLNINI